MYAGELIMIGLMMERMNGYLSDLIFPKDRDGSQGKKVFVQARQAIR